MSVTLTQLRTQCYNILREIDENSSAYPYTFVDSLINSAQLRICSGLIKNTFNGSAITKGSLPFLEKRKFYANIQSTTLSAVTSVGATSLSVVDTTDFPTAGSLWINGDIVAYTGKGATSFTTVTGVEYAWESGTYVYPAFAMPTDYMASIEVSYNNGMNIPYKASKQIYRDQVGISKGFDSTLYNSTGSTTPFPWLPPYYTIWEGAYFLPFWIDNSTGFFTLHYEKVPTVLSAVSDTATISSDIYAQNTIAYLAVGELMFNRGEEQRAIQLLTFAYGQIEEMYNYYNNQGSEDIDGQQVVADKGSLNI